MKRLFKFVLKTAPLALAGAVIVKNLPELRRYLRMKEM